MEIETDMLIALCYILNDFEKVQEDIKNLVSGGDVSKKISALEDILYGKKVVGYFDVKNFYKNNKKTIDIIEKYSDIYDFIREIVYTDWGFNIHNKLDQFYKYLISHKSELMEILALLEKIKLLKIKYIILSETTFTNEVYKISEDKSLRNDNKLYYLENMEAIPHYYNGRILEYRTRESNYAIVLRLVGDNTLVFGDVKIILNNLTFNPDLLPSELTKESTYDKIIALRDDTYIKNCEVIKKNIDLRLLVGDMRMQYVDISKLAKAAVGTTKSEEIMSEYRIALFQIERLLDCLNAYVVGAIGVSRDELEQEKKLYLSRGRL